MFFKFVTISLVVMYRYVHFYLFGRQIYQLLSGALHIINIGAVIIQPRSQKPRLTGRIGDWGWGGGGDCGGGAEMQVQRAAY